MELCSCKQHVQERLRHLGQEAWRVTREHLHCKDLAAVKKRSKNKKTDGPFQDTVSGSYELPMAAKQLIDASRAQGSETASDLLGSPAPANKSQSTKKTGPFDAVICIGVVIKGGTAHFEYICDAVTHGIMRVQLDTGVPVIFGVLTCYNDEQAIARSSTEEGFHHSEEWATAAVESGLRKHRKL